jgi:hypothetical protein
MLDFLSVGRGEEAREPVREAKICRTSTPFNTSHEEPPLCQFLMRATKEHIGE